MRGNKKYKKGKPKCAPGGFLQENSGALQQGMLATGDLIAAAAPNVGGATAKGALSGAAAGTSIMPGIGTAVGAVVGAASSFIGAKRAEKKAAEAERKQDVAMNFQATQNAIANAGADKQTVRRGGKLASKLKPLRGGGLVPVSGEAVEVQANDPSLTDSVELESAFVDNNEIIDNKNRVFSDDLLLPSGKSIAKQAKTLEKMKSESSRFGDSNSLIDSKLDKLFAHQEAMKAPINPAQFEQKKKVTPFNQELNQRVLTRQNPEYLSDELQAKDKKFYDNVDKTVGEQFKEFLKEREMKKKTLARGGKVKPKFGPGGDIDPYAGIQRDETIREDGFAGVTGKQPSSFNSDQFQKGVTSLATFTPNIVNAALQKRLKGPAIPELESMKRLKRVDPRAQLAGANRAYNQAKGVIGANTAQGSNLAAATGNLLAKRLAGENQIYGVVNNQNSQIQNQEALMNQVAGARNIDRLNNYSNNKVEFNNKKLQLTSENVANLSGKILQQGKEKNEIDRDKLALEVIGKSYGDSGVMQRNLDAQIDEYMKRKGLSKGGKLKLTKKKK